MSMMAPFLMSTVELGAVFLAVTKKATASVASLRWTRTNLRPAAGKISALTV